MKDLWSMLYIYPKHPQTIRTKSYLISSHCKQFGEINFKTNNSIKRNQVIIIKVTAPIEVNIATCEYCHVSIIDQTIITHQPASLIVSLFIIFYTFPFLEEISVLIHLCFTYPGPRV